MKFSDIPLDPTSRMLRQFAGAWLVLFVVLAGYRHFKEQNGMGALVFLGFAQLGMMGLIAPVSVRWLFIGVTVVTFPIGVVMANILMAVTYYLIMTPIGLAMRLSGRDALRLNMSGHCPSHWQSCERDTDPNRYLKQY